MTTPTMRSRFAETAQQILDDDPMAAVVLAEISVDLFDETREKHPDRVLNVGIRESLMISTAGGLGLSGMHPIAHSYAPFLVERSFEQIKLDLSHQDVPATLVSIGGSYDVPQYGRTHHSPMDVALLDALPGWSVHVPGHADEVPRLLRDWHGTRSYVRLSAVENSRPYPEALDGKLVVVRPGNKALVVAVGPMLDRVLTATEGLDLTIAYAATARPFDSEGLRKLVANLAGGPGNLAANNAGDAVVLVEPYLAGTSARPVSEALADRPHRLLSLGVGRGEVRTYGEIADHDALHGLDPAGLRRQISTFI